MARPRTRKWQGLRPERPPPGNGKAPRSRKWQGPRMYEMQGPCPVAGRWPAGCPAGWRFIDRLLVPGSRLKVRFPGSSCVPGVAPGVVPVSGSDVFLLPPPGSAQGAAAVFSKLFSRPQRIHSHGPCCPPEQELFHRTVHNFTHTESLRVTRTESLRAPSRMILGGRTEHRSLMLLDLSGLTSGAREDDELLGRSGHRDIAVDRSFDTPAERLRVDEDDQVELKPLRQDRGQ